MRLTRVFSICMIALLSLVSCVSSGVETRVESTGPTV